MSRSKKKTPIQAIANSDSEKEDKREANRKFRRTIKQQLVYRVLSIEYV
ncbi:hypothetical protein [Reichenbachiella sp.]